MVCGHTKNASWFDDAQPQCSMESKAHLLPWGGQIPGAKWDYEFIFPLFLQVRNLKMARIYSTEMFEEKRENLMMGKTFMNIQRFMRKTTLHGSREEPDRYQGKRIEEHFDLLFMMVEHVLDLLPSKQQIFFAWTASALGIQTRCMATRLTGMNSRNCYSVTRNDTIHCCFR